MNSGGPSRRSSGDAEFLEFVDLLLESCRVLMECGCSSNRVELLSVKLGAAWGFQVEAAAMPTCVWITVRRDQKRMLEMTRIRRWSIDLDRLAKINDLVDLIYERKVTIKNARLRLEEVASSKPPYRSLLTLVAGGGSSLGLIYFYGGTPLELALVFPAGLSVQAMQKYVFTAEDKRYLSDFLSAAIVSAYLLTCHQFFPAIDVPKLTVGGIASLVPGLALVNAVHEIAQKNLVSGAGKLFEAMVIALSLVFGVFFVYGTVALFAGAH